MINMESFLQILQTKEFGLFGFFLFLSLAFLWPKRSKTATATGKSPPPPEVSGAWPIIGHLHLFGGPQPPHVTFGAMADKYGPAFIFRLGQFPTLIVSDKELLREVFTTNDTFALTRPPWIMGVHMGYDNAMFGFCQYGAYWREIRKLVSLELLSVRRLQLLKHIRVVETEMSIKELYKLWDDQPKRSVSSSGFVAADMNTWFGNLTLNVILRMIAGKRYYGGSVDASEEKEAKKCQEVLREIFHLTGLYMVSDLIPQVRWMDLGGSVKKMKKVAKDMDEIAEQWIKEHRQKRKSGKANGDDQDFMDVMISLLDGADIAANYDADTITKATCVNLIAGGSDTTNATLVWAISLIVNNPQVLRKVQEELDNQVGKDRLVEESDIPNLVYLQAIVKETLRLYPAAPLGGMREFTEDCTIGGYHITKGTRLVANLWKLHRDPHVFHEPLKFMPERFLTTHKDIDTKGQNFELLPFSSGRRICPGVTFGLQMLHLVLASVLHAFDFSAPSDEPIDLTETAGLIDHKATPLHLLVSPRLSPAVYN